MLADLSLFPFPGPGEKAGMGFTKVKCSPNPDLEHLKDGTGQSVGAD